MFLCSNSHEVQTRTQHEQEKKVCSNTSDLSCAGMTYADNDKYAFHSGAIYLVRYTKWNSILQNNQDF